MNWLELFLLGVGLVDDDGFWDVLMCWIVGM